jgi:nucleoside-diphosphate-sugar epimerase
MNYSKKRIAILGATGHIAKSLIYSFRNEPNCILHLFTRSVDKTILFARKIGLKNPFINKYAQFNDFNYSSIINCVGIGDPDILKAHPEEVFFVTEEIDLLIISYLRDHPQTTYICFSSGAVYGTEFSKSVNDDSITTIAINNLMLSDFYGIAKINAEAKHRSLQNFKIVDLRIFGFYSRFIEIDRPYLLSEIISSLKTKKTFITSQSNITRDYIHPNDLAELVKRCMELEEINMALDVCSKKSITKFDILEYFKTSYGFEYSIGEFTILSVTGNKTNYFSESNKLAIMGFEPQYTSFECIKFVTNEILQELKLNYGPLPDID